MHVTKTNKVAKQSGYKRYKMQLFQLQVLHIFTCTCFHVYITVSPLAGSGPTASTGIIPQQRVELTAT